MKTVCKYIAFSGTENCILGPNCLCKKDKNGLHVKLINGITIEATGPEYNTAIALKRKKTNHETR